MRVLIAGCGYVGERLGEKLVAAGHEVWGLRRDPTDLPSEIRPIRADLQVPSDLERLPTELDVAVYAASAGGYSEEAYRGAYVRGWENLLRAMALSDNSLHRVFFVSSSSVYGDRGSDWVDEETSLDATSGMGFATSALLEGERLAADSPWPATVVRFSGIYGPRREGFIRRVRAGEARPTLGPPRYLNLIHREDCAGVLFHLIGLENPQSLYLASDCEPNDTSELVEWMAARLGMERPIAVPAENVPGRRPFGNKRCRNARLLDSGYRFEFPTARDGYDPLIREYLETEMG